MADAKGAQGYRSLGGWKHLCICADKLCTQGEQGKEGGSRTETKDLSCSSKVGIYMLGTVHVSIQVFFTEMVIFSSQTCYKYFPSGTYLPARPDPWLLHFFGVIFAFLSLVNMGNLITLLVKRICGSAGSDDSRAPSRHLLGHELAVAPSQVCAWVVLGLVMNVQEPKSFLRWGHASAKKITQ